MMCNELEEAVGQKCPKNFQKLTKNESILVLCIMAVERKTFQEEQVLLR